MYCRLQMLVRHSDLPSRCACWVSQCESSTAAACRRAVFGGAPSTQVCSHTAPLPRGIPTTTHSVISCRVSPRHTSMVFYTNTLVFFNKELTFDPSGGPAFRNGEFLLIVTYLFPWQTKQPRSTSYLWQEYVIHDTFLKLLYWVTDFTNALNL